MKAQWFYLQNRWLRQAKPVGPISEPDLLLRIDSGKIEPTTMLKSSKTKDRWVPMSSVPPAFERWRKVHS